MIIGFDLETTGLNPKTDRIIELAFVIYDDERRKTINFYNYLIDPGIPIPAKIVQITGIDDRMIRIDGVFEKVAIPDLLYTIERLNPKALVAHNGINFDIPFLHAAIDRIDYNKYLTIMPPIIDTRIDIEHPGDSPRTLKAFVNRMGKENTMAHRAIFDTIAMLESLMALKGKDVDIISELLEVQKSPMITLTHSGNRPGPAWYWNPAGHWDFPTRSCFAESYKEFFKL